MPAQEAFDQRFSEVDAQPRGQGEDEIEGAQDLTARDYYRMDMNVLKPRLRSRPQCSPKCFALKRKRPLPGAPEQLNEALCSEGHRSTALELRRSVGRLAARREVAGCSRSGTALLRFSVLP